MEGRRGGSVMKEESQMGQTLRDRLNSVKELNVWSALSQGQRRVCVCV